MSFIQTGDWKKEKHVPVIEIEDTPKKNEPIHVIVSVGREKKHPNTTAHHISWIRLLFYPDGEKFPIDIGLVEFNSHGASTSGSDTSTVYTEPTATFVFRTEKPGKLIAISYCNIHGLWSGEKELRFE